MFQLVSLSQWLDFLLETWMTTKLFNDNDVIVADLDSYQVLFV